MKTIWKDIRGYEGLYQVSNTGRVRSLPRDLEQVVRRKDNTVRVEQWHYNGKELKPMPLGSHAHVFVRLYGRNRLRCTYKVCELVLEAFDESRWKQYCLSRCKICYKDSNIQNCSIDNLDVVEKFEYRR